MIFEFLQRLPIKKYGFKNLKNLIFTYLYKHYSYIKCQKNQRGGEPVECLIDLTWNDPNMTRYWNSVLENWNTSHTKMKDLTLIIKIVFDVLIRWKHSKQEYPKNNRQYIHICMHKYRFANRKTNEIKFITKD